MFCFAFLDVMSTDLILEMPHKYRNNIVNVILITKDNSIFYFVIDVVYRGLLTIVQLESNPWPERHYFSFTKLDGDFDRSLHNIFQY